MEPIYFVLAIMGCGDARTECREARVEPVRFQTAAQCRAALPEALARNTDLDFPVIGGACRANGERMVKAAAKTPWG